MDSRRIQTNSMDNQRIERLHLLHPGNSRTVRGGSRTLSCIDLALHPAGRSTTRCGREPKWNSMPCGALPGSQTGSLRERRSFCGELWTCLLLLRASHVLLLRPFPRLGISASNEDTAASAAAAAHLEAVGKIHNIHIMTKISGFKFSTENGVTIKFTICYHTSQTSFFFNV